MSCLLPPEVWSLILQQLPGPSLCSVRLVCRHFRELTQDPALWRHVTVSREAIQRLGLHNLLDNQRLARVTRLDLSYLDLTEASRESLLRLMERFEAVYMRYCNLSQQQLSSIVSRLASSATSQLREVSLDSICLTSIPVESLTRAVTSRQRINLNNTGLSASQLNSVLLHSPSSHLQSLVLSGVDMSQAGPFTSSI